LRGTPSLTFNLAMIGTRLNLSLPVNLSHYLLIYNSMKQDIFDKYAGLIAFAAIVGLIVASSCCVHVFGVAACG
jgi:hypothetical protein